MPSYPASPKAYPVTPKAYPGSPKAYPGSGAARYPAGGTSLDSFSQSSYAEGLGALTGLASFSQASQVDGSGVTNADIIGLTGIKAVFDSNSTITRNDASITAGQDLSNAAWTKTQCTITTNISGTADRMTVSVAATTPTVSQNITNVAQLAASMVPLTVTWWFSFETIQWVVLEFRASTAVSRVFFDILNGVVGTQDALMTGSIAAETRAGTAGFRCTATATGVGSTITARFGVSTIDATVTVPASGTTVLADDATVDQKKWQDVQDRVGNTQALAQATVNLQPGYELGANGKPCRRYYGGQYMFDVVAAHVAALAASGADAEYTVFYVAEVLTIKLLACIIGAGNSAQAAKDTRLFGTTTTGNGRYTNNVVDDTTASSINTSTSDQTADLHVGEWYTSSSGQAINMKKNGTAVPLASSAQNMADFVLDRLGEGVLPRTTATSIFVGRVYALVVVQGTPDSSINSTIRQFLAAQYAITVAP